jgi:hypothetical protein
MAIVFEKQKKQVNWIVILFILFSSGFVVFAAYYLFFAPTPRIDLVLPEQLERAGQISRLEFIDPAAVLTSPVFKSLRTYIGSPSIGSLGRSNPFFPL